MRKIPTFDVSKGDLVELKALSNPPDHVIQVMGAVMTALGREPDW